MSKNGWGKAKYGSDDFKRTGKPGKLPGNNFIRILPPLHSLAEEGIWAVYRTTHWGYSGVSSKDPTKPVVRPFLCIEDKDRRTGITRVECAECNLYNLKDKEAEALEAKLKAEGRTDDQIKGEMEEQNLWLQKHSPERKWYLNVKYKDGTFGDYKINHKTHKKGIDNKIKELFAEQEIDALDPDQGVWFNIKRTGNGFDTPDTIEIEMESVEAEVNGKKVRVQQIVSAPLTVEDFERATKELRDLSTAGGTVLTASQIRDLTKSSGDPEEVDAIMGARKTEPKRAAPPASEADDEVGPAVEAVSEALGKFTEALKSNQNAEPVVTKASTIANPGMTEAEMIAKRDAILAKRAADAKAKADAEAAAKAAATPKPAMSDDEYLLFFDSTVGKSVSQ